MANSRRDIVDAVVAVISSGVTAAANWKFWRAEPIYMQAIGGQCAVWFESGAFDDHFNTSGSRDAVETYGIRYWEPAPESASGAVVDEAAALVVEQLMEATMAVLFDNETGIGTSYQTWAQGCSIFIGTDNKQALRGFEIAFTARRPIAFT